MKIIDGKAYKEINLHGLETGELIEIIDELYEEVIKLQKELDVKPDYIQPFMPSNPFNPMDTTPYSPGIVYTNTNDNTISDWVQNTILGKT